MDVIERYRKRRDGRLRSRGFRIDDEEETNKSNSNAKKVNHGNTKLPFGLCKRQGIEVGKEWTPRDAWDALADKGITPASEFEQRSPKKTTIKTGRATYTNVRVRKVGDSYIVAGDMQPMDKVGLYSKVHENTQIARFKNKKEMFACLQEYGVNHAVDPDTGEKVNPVKMDLPKTVAKKDEQRFTDLVLGTRVNKTGRAYDRRGFTLVAKDFDGKKWTIGVYDTPEKAKEYARKFMKCKPEDLRETKDYKAWSEKWKSPDEEYAARHKGLY